MNGIPSLLSSTSEESIERLARAIRFSLCALVVGFSYITIRSALYLRNLEVFFPSYFGGQPPPPATAFAFHAHPIFFALSIAYPLVAIGGLFFRRLSTSIYLYGALILAVFLQVSFIFHAYAAVYELYTFGFAAPAK